MEYSKEFNWIKDLQSQGYKNMIMPKGGRKKFYATKIKSYSDASKFDEFVLEDNEKWIPGSDARGVMIRL